MILKFRWPVPPDTRFTDEAVNDLVGKPFNAKIEQETIGEGRVISARNIEDGKAIEFTVKWPRSSIVGIDDI